MGCTKVLFFFLLQSTADFSTEKNSIPRSSYFEIRENKRLKGNVVKRFDSQSLSSCSRLCLENAWCTSTNYKMPSKKNGKGTCELNKHDVSLINENANIPDEHGVTFSILLKGCLFTSCLNGGSCLPDKEKQTFSCSCLPPWTGDRCEIKLGNNDPVVTNGCPENWVSRGNSCYYVIDTPTLKWSDARTTCQTLGGDLAVIRSEDENNFIFKLVKMEGAWLGLYRKPRAGDPFYWTDDTPLANNYSAWAFGQPSNPKEKCVQIYPGSVNPAGKWNDNQCSLSDASQAPVILCQKGLM